MSLQLIHGQIDIQRNTPKTWRAKPFKEPNSLPEMNYFEMLATTPESEAAIFDEFHHVYIKANEYLPTQLYAVSNRNTNFHVEKNIAIGFLKHIIYSIKTI